MYLSANFIAVSLRPEKVACCHSIQYSVIFTNANCELKNDPLLIFADYRKDIGQRPASNGNI